MNWEAVILFLIPLTTGLIALSVRQHNKRLVELILTFSGAYLFALSITHLVPDLFYHAEKPIFFSIGLFILAGFLIQLILDFFSKGVEHGHIHIQQSPTFLPTVMIGLCIHSLIEGIPLGLEDHLIDHGDHVHHNNNLLYGIIIHKVPAAFILGLLLNKLEISELKKSGSIFLFASMSPLAMITAQLWDGSTEILPFIMAIVVGSFFHISTTILFEASTKSHKYGWYKTLALILGSGLALLSLNAH